MNIHRFRTAEGIRIPPADLSDLRSAHGDNAVAEALTDLTEGQPVPVRSITEAHASTAFRRLVRTGAEKLFSPGRIELLRSPAANQLGYHTVLKSPGGQASNFFFQELRWQTPKRDAPSVAQRWLDRGMRLKVMRRMLKLQSISGGVSMMTIRQALCVTGATPAQFKPGVAKGLIELFGARSVLDFSAGWGDRLCGFLASSAERYVGIDPDARLHPRYQALRDLCRTGKDVVTLCAAAEDVDMPRGEFDLVLTSPPYFDAERYGQGQQNQSWVRHPSAERWRDGFLLPTLERSWAALKPGGIMAVNLADVGDFPLCQWLIGGMAALGAGPAVALGMRLQGSNFSARRRHGDSGEPIWLWAKAPASIPPRLPWGPRLGPTQRLELARRYQAGEGATSLGREFGVTKRAIYKALARAGVPTRPVGQRSLRPPTPRAHRVSARDKAIADAAAAGGTPGQVAQLVGASEAVVRYSMRKQGLLHHLGPPAAPM